MSKWYNIIYFQNNNYFLAQTVHDTLNTLARPKSNTVTAESFVIPTYQSKPTQQDYVLYIKN